MNEATGFPVSGLLQNGTNSGINRQFHIDRDYLIGRHPIKGKPYYYAVSYYAYNSNGNPKAIEMFSNPIEIKYQDTLPGLNYGDTIGVVHTTGNATGDVTVLVDDQSVLTAHSYSILFNGVDVKWSLKDNNTGNTIVQNKEPGDDEVIIDGLRIKVLPSIVGMVNYSIPNGELNWSWLNATSWALEGFHGSMGAACLSSIFTVSSSVSGDMLKNVLIKFADADTDGTVLNLSDPNVSFGHRYLRGALYPPAKPEFIPYIINESGGYAYQDFNKKYPLAAYDVSTSTPRRLAIGFLEHNVIAGRVDGKYNPPSSNDSIDNSTNFGPREWFFIFDKDYSESPYPALMVDILSETNPLMWFGMPTRLGTNTYHQGDEFLIIAGSGYTVNDVYDFTSPIASVESITDGISYQLYQNYPNPFNPSTTIQFSVPEKSNVKLEIFNILGQKVTTLINSEMDRGVYKKEFNAAKFASGVYIYRIQAGNFVSSRKLLLLK